MRVLGLLCVVLRGICWANAASHSLKYIYTVVIGDTDFPEFSITGLVNDEQFVHYDSDIRRMIPQTEWREISVDKQYWDKQTQKALYAHQIFKDNIGIAMQHFRSTQGVHFLEWIVGCQWNDETGVTGGIEHYGYDGKHFLTDDMITWNFIPPAQLLFISAVKLSPAELENDKQFQTQICIESLKKYVSYRSTLERTVASEVSVREENIKRNTDIKTRSNGVIISCWVVSLIHIIIGFAIWKGHSVPPEVSLLQKNSTPLIRNRETAFISRLTRVQHKSLKRDIVLPVREENIKRNTDIKSEREGEISRVRERERYQE